MGADGPDNTGLVYLRARYYAPGVGRFLSRDTWPGERERPLSLNGWAYVEGNVINWTDPSGHLPTAIPPISDFGIGFPKPDGALWGFSWDAALPGFGPVRFCNLNDKRWIFTLWGTMGGTLGEETVVDLVHQETATFRVEFLISTLADIASFDVGYYEGVTYGFKKPNHTLKDYQGLSVCGSLSPGFTTGFGGSYSLSFCGPGIEGSGSDWDSIDLNVNALLDPTAPGISTLVQQMQGSAGLSVDIATKQISRYTLMSGPRPSTPAELAWARLVSPRSP